MQQGPGRRLQTAPKLRVDPGKYKKLTRLGDMAGDMNTSARFMIALLAGAGTLAAACASPPHGAGAPAGLTPLPGTIEAASAPGPEAYFADIEIIASEAGHTDRLTGIVFHDLNGDGRHDPDEPGIAGTLVSNGYDVVTTGPDGRYMLDAREDMSVFVIQPAGWRTPTDENWMARFSYEHKPAGSPKPLRFGGLAPTGPLPAAINFPLRPSRAQDRLSCLMIGDVQTYNNIEVGYFRDSLVNEVTRRQDRHDCAVFLGDVVGDDLGLLSRLQSVGSAMQVPQYYVHGNHDFDFDADSDADSADSWRRLYGPAYYAFEIADTLFIALDNVVYPCGAEDAKRPGREFCLSETRKAYNGRVTETQMTWLANLLARIPDERRIVFLHHIPFVSFVDHGSSQHQTDNLADIHSLVAGRQAMSFSGHTHTLEILEAGDSFEGWQDAVGVVSLPFAHIIAGAASGGWWNGDFDMDGVPMSLSRLGEPRGYLVLESGRDGLRTDFIPLGTDTSRKMALSLNTPGFRNWFDAILDWRSAPAETRDPVPPLSLNDLPDVKLVTPDDLAQGVYLTANIWQASTGAEVTVSLNGADPLVMTRTQSARGEAPRTGAEYADPYAAMRQLSVSRIALQSRSGNDAAQGLVAGRRPATGPQPPQPTGSVADRSLRLWRARLPEDLAPGTYTARVTSRQGEQVFEESLIFEVVLQRPQPDWRAQVWSQFENGPPLR